MSASLSTYLPSSLLGYFEEPAPHIYDTCEYKILFGYLRWIRCYPLDLYSQTRLIPVPTHEVNYANAWEWEIGRDYLPPFIRGANIMGLDTKLGDHSVLYEGQWQSGYVHPTSLELIPQMSVYLCSYDVRFQWSTTVVKLLWNLQKSGGFIAAARAAASIGNFPLTCLTLDHNILHHSYENSSTVACVLLASIDKGFFDKLCARYSRVGFDYATISRSFLSEMIFRDDVERFSWYLPKIKGTELIPILLRSKAERIKAFLVASGFTDQ